METYGVHDNILYVSIFVQFGASIGNAKTGATKTRGRTRGIGKVAQKITGQTARRRGI